MLQSSVTVDPGFQQGVNYIAEDGTEKTCRYYELITSASKTWNGGGNYSHGGCNGGYVEINGGEVHATVSGKCGTGIGCGEDGRGANVTISGGVAVASLGKGLFYRHRLGQGQRPESQRLCVRQGWSGQPVSRGEAWLCLPEPRLRSHRALHSWRRGADL